MSVKHLTDGNDDGTVFGQSITELTSVYGTTPVAQSASASQDVAVATTTTKTTTLNAAAIDAVVVLANQIRKDLVAWGIIKGAV